MLLGLSRVDSLPFSHANQTACVDGRSQKSSDRSLTAKCLLTPYGSLAGDARAPKSPETEGGVLQGRDHEGGNGLVRHLSLFAAPGRSLLEFSSLSMH